MTSRTFIFAGGGTGGHIFPGLAIAEEIARRDAEAHFHFICSQRPIDAEILQREQAPFTPIPAQPFGLKPRVLLRFLKSWGASVRASRAIIREARAQARDIHVIAMGGFVAPAVVQAARAERVPSTLVNLDAVPGLANRWIARRAERVFTTYPMTNRATWRTIAPVVRAGAVATDGHRACRAAIRLDPDRPVLVILGGSQGAGSINQAMIALSLKLRSHYTDWQVFHQTGKSDVGAVERAYHDAGITSRVMAFTDQVAQVWGAAEIAIARSGAGTVAEAWANAVPTIFLPYPYHRDDHQRANAAPLVNAGGARVLTDQINPEHNAAQLLEVLGPLLHSPQQRDQMRAAMRSLGPADGAASIASALLGDAGA